MLIIDRTEAGGRTAINLTWSGTVGLSVRFN
jgi:hypothetical protein